MANNNTSTKDWRELQELVAKRQAGEEEDIDFSPVYEQASEGDRRKLVQTLFPEYAPGNIAAGARNISEAASYTDPDLSEIAKAVDYGASSGDFKVPLRDFVKDPINMRANAQSQGAKVVNGLLKMPIYAASTYVDNTIGLIDSLLEIGYDAGNGGEFNPTQSGINTYTAETMQKWRDWSERVLPNYRTTEELDDPQHWYKRLNGNFWGDVILKNFGFTLGAGLSGATLSRLSSIARGKKMSDIFRGSVVAADEGVAGSLAEKAKDTPKTFFDDLIEKAKQLKTKGIENQLVGGIGGALGESRMEAMMAAREFHDPMEEKINAEYSAAYDNIIQDIQENNPEFFSIDPYTGEPRLTQEGEQEALRRAQAMNDKRQDRLDNLESETRKLANTVFWLNMPLLAADNVIQFGRFFAGDYATQFRRRTRGKLGALKGKGSTVGDISRGLLNAYTEGQEEMLQKVFSEGAKKIADTNMAAFNNKQFDKRAITDVGKWMHSMLDTAGEVVMDATSWEEFTAGFLTGALGIPGVGKGKHLIRDWNGGILGGIQDSIHQRKQNQELAKMANDLYNNGDKLQTIMKGLVRHQVDARIKDSALADGDRFVWNTADNSQLINAVMTYASIGRLDVLEDMADGFANVSKKDIAKMRSLTSGEDALDTSLMDKSDDEVIDFFHKKAGEVKDTIQQYRKMYDVADFYAKGPAKGESQKDYFDRLSNSLMSGVVQEILYTQLQMKNFESRYRESVDSVLKELHPIVEKKASAVNKAGNSTKAAQKAQELLSEETALRNLFGTESPDRTSFVRVSEGEQKNALSVLDSLSKYTDDAGIQQNIDELKKLVDKRQLYYDKLYDPRGLGETILSAYSKQAVTPEQTAQDLTEDAVNNTVTDVFENAKNIKSIKDYYDYIVSVYDSQSSPEMGEQVLTKFYQEIEESDNDTLKGFKQSQLDFDDYRTATTSNLSSLRESRPVDEAMAFKRAIDVFEEEADNAYTIDELHDYLLARAETETDPRVKELLTSIVKASQEDMALSDLIGSAPKAETPVDAEAKAVETYANMYEASRDPLYSIDAFKEVWDSLNDDIKGLVADQINSHENQVLKDMLAEVTTPEQTETTKRDIEQQISSAVDYDDVDLNSWADGKFEGVVLTDAEKDELAAMALSKIEELKQSAGITAGPPTNSNFDIKEKEKERSVDAKEKSEAEKQVHDMGTSIVSGDRLQVYSMGGLKAGVMVDYVEPVRKDATAEQKATAEQANQAREFLREHKQQEFIDYGALAAMQLAYAAKGEQLPVYFMASPVVWSDNPFSRRTEKGKVVSTILFAVEITDEDRHGVLAPYFKNGLISDDTLFTIRDQQLVPHTYQIIGTEKAMFFDKNNPDMVAAINSKKHNLLYNTVIRDGINKRQKPKEGNFYIAQDEKGNRISSHLGYIFSGRNILRETVTDDIKKVPLRTSLKEYKDYGGKTGFALITIDPKAGTPLTRKSSPTVPDMPRFAIKANPGSLWMTTRGADGRNHWTYVNIARVSEYFNTHESGHSDYINELLSDIESLFDSTKDFEGLRATARRIYDKVYFGKNGGIRFTTRRGSRIVKINDIECHSAKAVLDAIQAAGLRFQVGVADLTDAGMQKLIDSDILYSDMLSFIRRGANFGVAFLDEEGKPEPVGFTNNTPGTTKNKINRETESGVNIQLNVDGTLRGYKVLANGNVVTMETEEPVTNKSVAGTVRVLNTLSAANRHGVAARAAAVEEAGGRMLATEEGYGYAEMYQIFEPLSGEMVFAKKEGENGAILPATREAYEVFAQSLGDRVYTEDELRKVEDIKEQPEESPEKKAQEEVSNSDTAAVKPMLSPEDTLLSLSDDDVDDYKDARSADEKEVETQESENKNDCEDFDF